MGEDDKTIYGNAEADFLKEREKSWDKKQLIKFDLILENLGECHRLVDVGCGWGQFLKVVCNQVEEVWGLDESDQRTSDLKENCPKAKMVISRADNMPLPSDYFDAVVNSQMLHEVKLFGSEGELEKTLAEIHRILKKGGKYLLVDHRNCGEGTVECRLPEVMTKVIEDFESKYKYYPFTYEFISKDTIKISRRALQDFLSKVWSLNTPMESMEMVETHNVFSYDEIQKLLTTGGFEVTKWLEFASITDDIEIYGCELIKGEPWGRKFLCVARKA
jgi:ubiquinone/menaquinone biosynthesis C-methylase UbiE